MRDSQVVLIADDPGFARDLMARWQTECSLPGITVMNTDLLSGSHGRQCASGGL